jgi:hypothetical protein
MDDSLKTILKHIRFARGWLDKAEDEFASEEKLKGELTLTLAQAEVKHAWEASQRIKTSQEGSTAIKVRNNRLGFLPGIILVSFLTLVMFNFVFRDDMGRGAADFSKLLANGIEKKVVEVNKEIPGGIQFIDDGFSEILEGGTDSSKETIMKDRHPFETYNYFEGER